MTDEGKLRAQHDKGERAKRELELLKEFLEQCRDEVRNAWEGSRVDDVQLREDAWHMQKAIDRLEACYRATVANGEFARHELFKEK